MIGLVRIDRTERASPRTTTLPELPVPPALAYAGLAILCRSSAEVARALQWFRQVRIQRPSFPLGMVAEPVECARYLAVLDQELAFLLDLYRAMQQRRRWRPM